MKMTCYICVANLILLGILSAITALSGFDVITFLSLGMPIIYKSYFAICGISALFCIYSLIVFKPFKGLK